MNDIPRMPIKEFRERGYLHEINRLVLHPLGLGLEVSVAAEPFMRLTLTEGDIELIEQVVDVVGDSLAEKLTPELHKRVAELFTRLQATGEDYEAGDELLGSVWDQRSDREGMWLGDDLLSPEKAASVCAELLERRAARKELLGWVVQPIETDQRTLILNYLDPE